MSARGASIRALLFWQRVAGPYWPYVCAAPFLAEDVIPHPTIPRPTGATDALVESISRDANGRLLVVADLPSLITLSAVPLLHRRGFRVVPIIQRWIVPNALLPSRRLLNALVGVARSAPLSVEPDRGVILCLDGERGGGSPSPETISPTRFDNRYEYPVCRFPSPRFLRSDNIVGVSWLSNGPLADDLIPYRELLTPDLPSHEVNLAGQELARTRRAG